MFNVIWLLGVGEVFKVGWLVLRVLSNYCVCCLNELNLVEWKVRKVASLKEGRKGFGLILFIFKIKVDLFDFFFYFSSV